MKKDYLINSWPYFENFHTLKFVVYELKNTYIIEIIGLCSEFKDLDIIIQLKFYYEEGQANLDLIKCLTLSKDLESLNIDKIDISNHFCEYMSKNLLKLKILRLYMCSGISLNEIKLIYKLEKLEVLDISYCKKIDDRVLELIGKLSKLQELNISGLHNVIGSGLSDFFNLRKFIFSNCKSLENDGGKYILPHEINFTPTICLLDFVHECNTLFLKYTYFFYTVVKHL